MFLSLFLALLDYVNRAHEIASSGINYLWTYYMDFFQSLVVAFNRPYARTFFLIFEKKIFLRIFFVFGNKAPYRSQISKRYSSRKWLLNPFTLFLNFLLSGPHKSAVWDFSNFEFLIFQKFLALLDYVSNYVMKSKIVRRTSSVCGINYLWSYCMNFFQVLVMASPGPYAKMFSFLKKQICTNIFRFR